MGITTTKAPGALLGKERGKECKPEDSWHPLGTMRLTQP